MFRDTRREKLRNRVIFAAVGVIVMTFGIWLNYRDGQGEQAAEKADTKVAVEESAEYIDESDTEEMYRKETAVETGEKTDKDSTGTEETTETYLIEEVDGIIKVFSCRQDGSRDLYMVTAIPFELLSVEDQQLFTEGVEIETEDELGRFLENFDS